MDFKDKIDDLRQRVERIKDEDSINEEATKTSLVLPFLQTLGYDVFNPKEVFPEYTSDVGTKKGEKVDYAICKDGEPIMLIEVKPCGAPLDPGKANQLHRYFQNTPSARVAILTNGIEYEFFSDLDRTNIMDSRPFMVLDMTAVDDALVPELKKLTADAFDEELALGAAKSLKYTREIKKQISQEFYEPSLEFIKFFASRVYDGKMVAHVVESFEPRVKRAFQEFINDQISDRLEKAMYNGSYDDDAESEEVPESKPRIVTTEDELQAFFMVKAILMGTVDVSRVFMRDTQSYCGILMDDNNRKPICRLYFNTANYHIGTFDDEKNETRHSIESIDDILGLAEELKTAALSYD